MGYKLKRATMRVNNARGLPAEYQEVEYIESSGTQWIDTGVKPTSDTVSQLKVMFLAWTGDVVYGYCWNDNTANYRLFNAYAGADGTTLDEGQFVFDTTHNNSYARVTTGTGHSSLNTIYELELGDFYIKDLSTGTNIVTGTAGTVTNIGNYTITLNNYKNTRYSQNRWYYVKIYESGTLIRDIVPCYRIADGVIGMYDLVNDVFYTNSGTGTFTKGADVPSMIEKQVRPTPSITQLYYDFTQSDGGWTTYNRSGGDTYRDSDGWYRTNTRSDGLIIAPSEIYMSVPNKITIAYTKNLSDAGIGCFLATDLSGDSIMASDYNHYSDFCTNTNGTTNYSSMGSNITGDITWEIDIDSSTTPRTVTHTFNSNIVINKNDGVMDNIWGSNNFMVRLCQWSSGTKAICFKTITFNY